MLLNAWVAEKDTRRSSVLLLCLVSFFATQTSFRLRGFEGHMKLMKWKLNDETQIPNLPKIHKIIDPFTPQFGLFLHTTIWDTLYKGVLSTYLAYPSD